MIITKYITKSCVVPEIKAETKADAIKELTHLLFSKKKLPNVPSAIEQIVAREVTESTGIGRGIAVPHARIPGMKSLACAVGRAPGGLDFMAVDREPVHLIFLICYPPAQQTTYLNFVATVSLLLKDKEHFDAMLSCETALDMFGVLAEVSETFDKSQEKTISEFKADEGLAEVTDGRADVMLLARLQLHHEMLAAAKSGRRRIEERIKGIRAMVNPRILKHFDRLNKGRAPALVPVEGDTCQGCFIRLPSKFVQQVRHDSDRIHTCINCSRYIYVV